MTHNETFGAEYLETMEVPLYGGVTWVTPGGGMCVSNSSGSYCWDKDGKQVPFRPMIGPCP